MTQLEFPRVLQRRRFLALTAGSAAAILITAACGDDDDSGSPTSIPSAGGNASPASPAVKSGKLAGSVVVGDVLDHVLWSDKWKGDFGSVTFKLHHGLVDGQDSYFIRTDASDKAFATAEKLVHVPLMQQAIKSGKGLAAIYLFENAPAQLPILSTSPHKADYSPAFRIHRVTFTGAPEALKSVAEITGAQSAGKLSIKQTDIVVNYPVVKWPGGELPNDQTREVYLGDGQLLEPVDVAGSKVTFKLHSCYPASRYIVTDVTIPEMATGMKIAPAPGATPLTEAGATAKILVFGSGLPGSGPMGFQKSVTDTSVGDEKWSPYWDHYTFMWKGGATPALLKSEAEIKAAESASKLDRFPGTPDTKGTLFMVNCPVPVLAAVPG